jgi:hypothetical protein
MFREVYNRHATRTFWELLVLFGQCILLPITTPAPDPLSSVYGHRTMNSLFSLVKHESAVRIGRSPSLVPSEPATTGPGSSPPHQGVCYFPWTYEDYKKLSWYEIEWTPARLRRWQAVVSRWKGVAAICGQSMRPNTVGAVS